jgi:hypothetical protein
MQITAEREESSRRQQGPGTRWRKQIGRMKIQPGSSKNKMTAHPRRQTESAQSHPDLKRSNEETSSRGNEQENREENGSTVTVEQEHDSERTKKSRDLLSTGRSTGRKEDKAGDTNRGKTIRCQRGIKPNRNCKY